MFVLKLFIVILLLTTTLNAREIRISATGGDNGKFYASEEQHNDKTGICSLVLSGKGHSKGEFALDPKEYNEKYTDQKFIGEWKDLYNLAHDAMKKNIIQGTAVDYFEHNNEKYQRTVKWEGSNKDNFSLVITIDKQ
jgi:hypothetical protein